MTIINPSSVAFSPISNIPTCIKHSDSWQFGFFRAYTSSKGVFTKGLVREGTVTSFTISIPHVCTRSSAPELTWSTPCAGACIPNTMQKAVTHSGDFWGERHEHMLLFVSLLSWIFDHCVHLWQSKVCLKNALPYHHIMCSPCQCMTMRYASHCREAAPGYVHMAVLPHVHM